MRSNSNSDVGGREIGTLRGGGGGSDAGVEEVCDWPGGGGGGGRRRRSCSAIREAMSKQSTCHSGSTTMAVLATG